MELRINSYKKEIARLKRRIAELEAGQKIPALLVSQPESMASILGDVDNPEELSGLLLFEAAKFPPPPTQSERMKAYWAKRKAAKAAAP